MIQCLSILTNNRSAIIKLFKYYKKEVDVFVKQLRDDAMHKNMKIMNNIKWLWHLLSIWTLINFLMSQANNKRHHILKIEKCWFEHTSHCNKLKYLSHVTILPIDNPFLSYFIQNYVDYEVHSMFDNETCQKRHMFKCLNVLTDKLD